MLSETEKNHLKATLVSRQNELIPQIQDHYGLENAQRQTTGELSNYDNHPGDLGTETYERAKDLAFNEHSEKELEDINRALHRLRKDHMAFVLNVGRIFLMSA